MYVTLKTDRGDTHQYIEEAINNGASGVLCTRPPECPTGGVSVVLVRNTVDALMVWSHFVLGKLGTQVIGVTGSSVKSVAIEAITRVLSTRYSVHSYLNDYEGPLSVPLSLARLKPDHHYVVLKLGVAQPGDMAEMVQAVQPNVGVITHVEYTHTDAFHDLDPLAAEMATLVDYLSPSGLAVLNYDDDLVREMSAKTRARVMTVGTERFGADLMAFNIVEGLNGTGFDLRYGSERYVGRWVPLLSTHQLYPVLMALAVGLYYEVPLEDALRALTEMSPLPGRMNPMIGTNGALIIDDTYSANPQSTLAALDWLNAVKTDNHRTILVMGDMEGLGMHNQLGHRMVGQRAAEVTNLILTEGADAALVGRAALDQGVDPTRTRTLYSTQDTINTLLDKVELVQDDIVLLTGGPSSRMELVVTALLESDEDREQLVRQDRTAERSTIIKRTRPSWVEVDTDALASNVAFIKETIGEKVSLMAVVKADGYGHGAVAVSQTALLNGADYLAVASIGEALELRDAGIEAPILVMSYMPVYAVRQAVRHDVSVALYTLDIAREYDRAARETDGKLRVHVKVDTGMGRLGVMAEDVVPMFRYLPTLQNLEIEGIYTHFSTGEDPVYTAQQVETFNNFVLRPLRAAGIDFRYVHAANSAGILGARANHFNMVRAGISMYGLSPAPEVDLPKALKPVMSWKTVIIQVRELPPGYPVGYGNTYRTHGPERIAIIPVGYADGFRRSPKTWREVLIHGQRAPLVGRVSMEKSAVNVTHIPGVTVGDEVTLLGRQGDDAITVDEIAEWLETINYEVVTTILPRVPRR